MQYAPLIRILLQKETRTLFFCGVAVLLLAVLVGCIIQKLRKQKAKNRSIRLLGGLFATSVILCLCIIQFGLSVRQRYLLSLNYHTLDVCQMEATLQARKRHLLWKDAIYCLLNDRWLFDGANAAETQWLVGECYLVDYLENSGYIVDSTFVLKPDRIKGHETKEEDRYLLQSLGSDVSDLSWQNGLELAALRRVGDYCDAKGDALAVQFHSNPCAVAMLLSEPTDQYLLKIYQAQGEFVCWLVIDRQTGDITHFWIES